MKIPTPILAIIPMSTYGYKTIESPRDLLEKAKNDLSNLKRANKHGYRTQAYHAFNCAITVWHVTDWVWESFDMEEFVNLGAYRSHLFEQEHGDCLRICKDLANGSKHRRLDRRHLDLDTSMGADVPDAFHENISARASKLGKGKALAVSIGNEDLRESLKIRMPDGANARASQVLEMAIIVLEESLAGLENGRTRGK